MAFYWLYVSEWYYDSNYRFLIQRYSVRGLFLTAMTLFTAGTILAGASPVFSVLLTARIIQASGAAIMMPLLMNVLLTSFPLEKRGAAMGIFGLVMIFAPAIGPTLSGWLIEHYEWRMLFHLVTPIAAIVLIGAFFLLKDKKKKWKSIWIFIPFAIYNWIWRTSIRV